MKSKKMAAGSNDGKDSVRSALSWRKEKSHVVHLMSLIYNHPAGQGERIHNIRGRRSCL